MFVATLMIWFPLLAFPMEPKFDFNKYTVQKQNYDACCPSKFQHQMKFQKRVGISQQFHLLRGQKPFAHENNSDSIIPIRDHWWLQSVSQHKQTHICYNIVWKTCFQQHVFNNQNAMASVERWMHMSIWPIFFIAIQLCLLPEKGRMVQLFYWFHWVGRNPPWCCIYSQR